MIFAGLFLIYCVRIMFNYSAGNSFNLAVPFRGTDRIFCPEGYFSLWGDSDQYMAQRMADRQMEYGSCLWFFECGVSDRSGFTWNGRKWIQREEEEKIHLKEYIEQIGNVFGILLCVCFY